jgi:hypothetical protein
MDNKRETEMTERSFQLPGLALTKHREPEIGKHHGH